MAETFRGTFTALVTPFTRDGALDLEAMGGLIDEQLAAGVDGLVVLGTTGESPTVSADEFGRILDAAVTRAGGTCTIIAGVGCNDTGRTVEQGCEAEALGVDGLLVVCPYYSRPSQAGIYEHYTRVADAVALPQLVYNIEGRTGVNIETDTLVDLASHSNIVGVKEASNDIDQIMDVVERTPDGFAVQSGSDHLTYPLIALGGDGTISVLSNMIPGAVKALVDAALAGEMAEARRLHYEQLPLARGCFLEGSPTPIKTALAWQGRIEEAFRLPMAPMRPETRLQWRNLLASQGLLPETMTTPLRATA